MRRAILLLCAGFALHAGAAIPGQQPAPGVVEAVGVGPQLQRLAQLARSGQGSSAEALALREGVVERVLLASFDVDETLGRIDAEAAHAGDSRSVLEDQKQHRETELNIATFALGGALGTAGSAMQLTRSLNHAGNALNVAAGASALSLSLAQIAVHGERRKLLSPYNMLAEVLGQTPNAQSRYPAVVEAYLQSPSAVDGELPDGVPPAQSLRNTWVRLHRLQGVGSGKGASVASAVAGPSGDRKLSQEELADREAMLHDLHGAVALLKIELRAILLELDGGAQ